MDSNNYRPSDKGVWEGFLEQVELQNRRKLNREARIPASGLRKGEERFRGWSERFEETAEDPFALCALLHQIASVKWE